MLNDAHDGTLGQADGWLKQNMDPLINNPAFQSSGLLIITFDEGEIKATSSRAEDTLPPSLSALSPK